MPLEYFLLAFPTLLLSLTVHEFGHAWVALRQGDDTAYMLGRVTLNPAAHIDPIGSLLLPGVAMLTGAPLLGWARPVPVNSRKFRHYRRGDLLVSLAGVGGNLVLIVVFALLSVLVARLSGLFGAAGRTLELLWVTFDIGIRTNLVLILFNLIPIPPLDGSHIVVHFLPASLAARYHEASRYGFLILWGLLLIGGFAFLRPLTGALYALIRGGLDALV